MKALILIPYLFFAIETQAQTNLFGCPTNKKTNFLHDVKNIFKQPTDTTRIDVFRFVQWYDCPNLTEDAFIETLFWRLPSDSVSFHLVCNHDDSTRVPFIYGVSALGVRFLSMEAKLNGTLTETGNWHVTGQIELRLVNRIDNTIIHQTIVMNDNFHKYVLTERKNQHPLFDFINGL